MKMQIIALLFSRFSRKQENDGDAFDQRLRSLAAGANNGRARRPHPASPHLFRRDMMGHA
jgi:hypothetical protein